MRNSAIVEAITSTFAILPVPYDRSDLPSGKFNGGDQQLLTLEMFDKFFSIETMHVT